jgi:hypothetical protein
MPATGGACATGSLLFGVVDLDIVFLQQLAGGVVHGDKGELVGDLRLDEGLFGRGLLELCLEQNEKGVRPKFILSLFALEIFLRKIESDLCFSKGELGDFELIDGGASFEDDGFLVRPLVVKVAALADLTGAERGLGSPIFDRQIK